MLGIVEYNNGAGWGNSIKRFSFYYFIVCRLWISVNQVATSHLIPEIIAAGVWAEASALHLDAEGLAREFTRTIFISLWYDVAEDRARDLPLSRKTRCHYSREKKKVFFKLYRFLNIRFVWSYNSILNNLKKDIVWENIIDQWVSYTNRLAFKLLYLMCYVLSMFR